MSAELMKSKFVHRPSSVRRPSVASIISEPIAWISFKFWVLLFLGYLPIRFFWNFEKKNFWIFYKYFSCSLTWDPQNATRPSYYSRILSNFVWFFFSVVYTKVLFWIFESLSLRFFHDFFFVSLTWNLEILSFWFLTNLWNSPLYAMGKQEISIIWKTSDRRAKRGEIWTSGVSVQCIQVTLDSYVLKVILGSFGAFPIFDNRLSQKRLVVERNGVKFRPRGWVFSVYRYFWQLSG